MLRQLAAGGREPRHPTRSSRVLGDLWIAVFAPMAEKPGADPETLVPLVEQLVVAPLLLGAEHASDGGVDPRLLLAQGLAADFEHIAPELAHGVAILRQDGADALLLVGIEIEPAREDTQTSGLGPAPVVAQDRGVVQIS